MHDVAELEGRALSYDCFGATRVADDGFDAPTGYRPFERSVRIGYGEEVFRASAEALLRWEGSAVATSGRCSEPA